MAEDESTEQNETQRIYVGGMEPPVLTVEMVQSRLVKTLSHELDILSFDTTKLKTNLFGEDTQTFFFMTAKVKDISKGTHKSAIEAVSKLYNNVKWKGCTLRVEKAKLHFLERLKIERDINKQHVQCFSKNSSVSVLEEVPTSMESSENRKIKRHLRIRRRYGEEAFVVDTKPMEAANQKDLHLLLKKQREKMLKHNQYLGLSRNKRKDERERFSLKPAANLSLQSKVFLNRSVHISFNENNIENTALPTNFSDYDYLQRTVSDHNSEVSSESSSTSSMTTKEKGLNDGANYNWSDENSNDSSMNSVSSGENDDDIDSENDESNYSSVIQLPQSNTVDAAYNWSDSDFDSDEDVVKEEVKSYDYNKAKFDDLDEFAASFNDEVGYSKKDFFQEDECSNMLAEDIDLDEDINLNLSVISKLFPELQMKNPFIFSSNVDQPKSASTTNSFGLMQRYDPLAANSVANFEEKTHHSDSSDISVKSDVDRNNPSSDSSRISKLDSNNLRSGDIVVKSSKVIEPSIISGTSNASELNADLNKNQKPSSASQQGQIYEQKKLENIFQQDRTSVGTTAFSISSLFQSEIDKDVPPVSSEQSTGFSFAFPTNDAQVTDTVTNKPEDLDISPSLIKYDAFQSSAAPEIHLKKRIGLLYNDEELNAYVNDFYNLNENIESVIESLRNPKSEEYLKNQEKWQESRKSLTSDWKRKHKYAVAQRKKRFRFR